MPTPDPELRQLEHDLGGEYQLVRRLGGGAFGTVYLARERLLHRLVAIKVLHAERLADDEERERFLREARTAAQLNHPGIASLIAVGQGPPATYMVMAFAPGESLATILDRDGPLSPEETRDILVQLADALDHAHERGIVHRDLKPENVVIERVARPGRAAGAESPTALCARLVDFGIAAFPRRDPGVGAVREHWGTPAFMSPEQALGETDLDARTDIYSLGLLGYVMLTGQLAFSGSSTTERLRQQEQGPRVPLRTAAPSAPADLIAIIERCLAFDPAARRTSAVEIRDALVARSSPADSGWWRVARGFGRSQSRRRESRARRGDVPSSAAFRLRSVVTGIAEELRFAGRSLRRSPLFAAAVVLTFALGIGANATIFGVIDRLLLRPPAHVQEPERVIRVVIGNQRPDGEINIQSTHSYPGFKSVRDHAFLFEQVAASYGVSVPFGRGAEAQELDGLLISASYFPLLGVRPALGRFILPDEDVEPVGAPVAVISHDLWRRRFGGDSTVIGRVMDLGARRYTVVGVAPARFTGTDVQAIDIWLPITAAEGLRFGGSQWSTSGGTTWLTMIARPRRDVTAAQALEQATPVFVSNVGDQWFIRDGTRLVGESILRTRGERTGAGVNIALLLGAMAALVLLIACANVANLLLVRSLRRRREIAVRLALGISRARLVGQLLTESLLLAALGGIAALAVAYWGGEAIRSVLFADVRWTGSPVDGRVFLFTAVVAATSGIVAGLVPALQSSRPDLTTALKAGAREGGDSRSRARATLVAGQTALAVVLLVGTAVFMRSLRNVNAMDLGLDPDRVLVGSMELEVIGIDALAATEIFEQIRERVVALPGVQSAAIALTVPFGASTGADVRVPGRDSLPGAPGGGPFGNAVSPRFFETLGTRIVRGRDFTDADGRNAEPVVIINEGMATRWWPGADPLAQCVLVGDDPHCRRIVGVVENTRRQNIWEDENLFLYAPLAQAPARGIPLLIVRPAGSDPRRAIETIRQAMQTTVAGLPYANVTPLSSLYARELRPARLAASMLGIFGALALIIATLGLYSVISFSVAQRTHEMGVRMALGANAGDVIRLVVRQGMIIAIVGVAAGLLIALATAGMVEPLLYEASARDPATLAAIVIMLLAVAVVASIGPAVRATRVPPVIALRSE